MNGTHRRRGLADYRPAVVERINAGEPFGNVEAAIDEVGDLTVDQKAALWLLAFSLRDPSEQQLDTHPRLAAVR